MKPPVGPQKPPVGGGPVVFDRPSAERVSNAVRYVERIDRTKAPRQGVGHPFSRPGVVAKATTSIGAASASFGTGTATLYTFDGTSWATDLTGVTVYNITDKTIASGAWLLLAWCSGQWFVTTVDSCSSLS